MLTACGSTIRPWQWAWNDIVQCDVTRIRAEGDAKAIVLKGEAKAQDAVAKTLTTSYLQYKAFDSPATRYYFVATGKNGMPIIVGTDASSSPKARVETRDDRLSGLLGASTP